MQSYPPARDDFPALAPVRLVLLLRRRLESHRRFDRRLFPQRADEAAHDIMAAGLNNHIQYFH